MYKTIILKACVCVLLLTITSCIADETAKEQTATQETPAVEKTAEQSITVEADETAKEQTATQETPALEKTAEQTVTAEAVAESESQEEPSVVSSEVLVSVGGEELTMEQVKWAYPDGDEIQISKFAKWWVQNELLNEEAERQGLTKQPNIIFLAEISRKRSISQLLLKDIQELTDEEILAYYEENKETNQILQEAGTMSFSHIKTKTLERAQAALLRANAGEDFNKLVKELSIADDKKNSGRFKKQSFYLVKARLGEELFNALNAAKTGDVVGPIQVKDGYEVVRLEEKKEPRTLPFEKAKARIKPGLQRERGKKATTELIAQLEEQAADRIVKSPVLLQMEKLAEQAAKPPVTPPIKLPVNKP